MVTHLSMISEKQACSSSGEIFVQIVFAVLYSNGNWFAPFCKMHRSKAS